MAVETNKENVKDSNTLIEIDCERISYEGVVDIQAWSTNDLDEIARLIATVDKDGKVDYLNDDARTDQMAQSHILTTRKKQLARKAYRLYVLDWCKRTGYGSCPEGEGHEVSNDSCKTYQKYVKTEFLIESYIVQLLSDQEHSTWKEVMEGDADVIAAYDLMEFEGCTN